MKTPKEKAKDLIEKFGKELALICCDEIYNLLPYYIKEDGQRNNLKTYWQQVKEEINKQT